MTDKEKAKAYDEALALAKRLISNNCTEVEKLCLKCVFPELKESEDERIRKTILTKMRACQKQSNFFSNDEIAYLEKQKEQKLEVKDPFNDEQFRRGYEAGKNDAEKEINTQLIHWREMAHEEMMKESFPDYGIEVTTNNGVSELKALGDVYENIYNSMEQKPAEWSDEDRNITEELYEYFRYLQLTSDKEFSPSLSIDEILEWLKSLHPKPKQEWNEDDKTILKVITSDVARMMHKCGVGTDEAIIRSKAIRWLEALCPNQNPEWNEEDKKMLWIIQLALTKHPITDKQEKDAFDWLNSLKPKPHWKPSEEQMGALSWMIENARGNIDFDPLKKLYEQLKKL